ncbi:MAG: PrsW family glutamic-type intramembrane protease [Acidimicrobiales bacterium]
MIWAWVSLIAVVVTAVAVPSTRRGMAVYLWVQYALVQFWLLARPKTITWRGFGLAFTAGVLLALPIGVIDGVVSEVFGWETSDTEALVWVAGPVEEALKLAPLLVLALVGRNRFRRLSVCDFILLGAASGSGFQFVEDAIRRVTPVGPRCSRRCSARWATHSTGCGHCGPVGATARQVPGSRPISSLRPWWLAA